MSSKRLREEDHYRSRETSRRKDQRNYHPESNYNRMHSHQNSGNNYYSRHHEQRNHKDYEKNYEYERNSKKIYDSNSDRQRTQHFENSRKPDQSNKEVDAKVSQTSTSKIATDLSTVKTENSEKPFVKEKVNFNKSGKLAEDTNMHNGVIVKYSEPIEAAKPNKNWRLYPFKNDESLPFIPFHKKSHYLLGRDRKVADIALDHPSVSKQHAVIQFRMVELGRQDGSKHKEIRPYLMDLESSNKTYLNNKEIDPNKYYQLLEKDVLKFGFSSREYVCLIDHEETK